MDQVMAQNMAQMKPQRQRTDPNAFYLKVAQRDFPRRHIYFILDGADLDQTQIMSFVLTEVNERLCRLVSDKIWHSD